MSRLAGSLYIYIYKKVQVIIKYYNLLLSYDLAREAFALISNTTRIFRVTCTRAVISYSIIKYSAEQCESFKVALKSALTKRTNRVTNKLLFLILYESAWLTRQVPSPADIRHTYIIIFRWYSPIGSPRFTLAV